MTDFKTIAAGVMGVAGYASTMPAITGALGLLGFTAEGIAAGSLAAAVQGPAVASGSLFSILQAAGATSAAGLVPVAPIIGGIVGTGVVIATKFVRS